MKFNTESEREQFINDNIKLVGYVLKNKMHCAVTDDIVQEGYYYLIKAVDNFDETKGISFSTFAVSYIRFGIIRYINYDCLIKPCRKDNEKDGKKCTFLYKDIISLNSVMSPNISEDNIITLEDMLPDINTDVEDKILTSFDIKNFIKTKLNDKEKQIMILYLQHYKQVDIVNKLDTSQSQISRILIQIRKKYEKYINNGSKN